MKKYDSIIIGFGKAGKTLSGYLASKGENVAMIEKSEEMYGGTCINIGCIPSKSLVTSGLKTKNINKNYEENKIDYTEAILEKRRLVSMLREKNFNMLNSNENITIYNGFGSFITDHKIKVSPTNSKGEIINDGEIIELEGEKIFINTGSTPTIPPIKGIENNPYVYYSNSLMDLDNLPENLLIIGGGYIALEFSSIYANFGSKVTVIQRSDKFLKNEDEDIANEIKQVLEDKGIEIILSANMESIEEKDNCGVLNYTVDNEKKSISANGILVATGRRANINNLNLENAGIKTNKRGIETNELLQTNVNDIWAMGDVVGGLQFTYISLDDYRIIKRQFEDNNKFFQNSQRNNVPFSVFIDPSFSRVGLNEKEAIEQGYNIKVSKLPVAAIPKAQVLKHPVGMLKAVIDKDTNKILGAMLLCDESYEVINTIKLAMDLNLDYQVLRDQIFTHPTISESLNDLFNV